MRNPRIVCLWTFLWPVVALAAFAALQIWIISLSDQIFREIARPSGPHTLSPSLLTRTRWLYTTFPGAGIAEVRRLPDERPLFLLGLAGCAAAMAVAGWLGAVAISALASMRAPLLRYSMGSGARLRAASLAVRMCWPLGLGLGAVLGGAAWFIGFERNSTARPAIDGLAPTVAQIGWVVLAWSVVVAAASVAFLSRSAALVGPSPLERCPRCRYPREGVPVGICPECGTPFLDTAPAPPSAMRCHIAIANSACVAVLIFAVACGLAFASLPSARDWFMLRSSERSWVFLAAVVSGAEPVVLKNLYGEVSLKAEHRPPADGSGDGSWAIQWHFAPSLADRERRPEASGALIISDRRMSPGHDASTVAAFPFGELWFGWRATDPGLLVQGSPPVFQDMSQRTP